MSEEWKNDIWQVNDKSFVKLALQVFQFQYQNNKLYQSFADKLNKTPATVTSVHQIPFLPISFFKTHNVCTTNFTPEIVFESSGTTGITTSKHLVKEKELYIKSFSTTFKKFYGDIEDYCVLGLLPSYLQRKNSSLVFMVDDLIKRSNHPLSSFYLDDFTALKNNLVKLGAEDQKILLIGVTYALLDFAEEHKMSLQNAVVMETGGMKGRKKEMLRQEVHQILKNSFGLNAVHSEYGMTELLSQAYSCSDGIFKTPPWMKILIREEDDPLEIKHEKIAIGGMNIIDLANLYSCSFIATEDIAKIYPDESFEVLGRLDNSDIRGCSLLAI